ncbi:MAG: DNA starvation/stationary phase protection protein [Anaerolineaceae bacterium]|jgi:starvation-inducible DNA-binding protein|nr:DNA starvation/stationary phase protection protein [Anaerolineaceae bacterium]MDD4043490.1 DNA starvation/stationary phase protection protein [Anaerolineaceae bacterium]MDD4578531.1 DNA starvation/stationary phase protection protein [Anaerolineaceae bacterium]
MSKKLDVYLSNLGVAYIKLHNLHWNVVGENFKPVHEYLEEIYDEVTKFMDETAEHQKMEGQAPIATMEQFLKLATIKEIESKDYPYVDALRIALEDITTLKDTGTAARKEADEKDEFTLVMMLEEHINTYEKWIWFIETMLK